MTAWPPLLAFTIRTFFFSATAAAALTVTPDEENLLEPLRGYVKREAEAIDSEEDREDEEEREKRGRDGGKRLAGEVDVEEKMRDEDRAAIFLFSASLLVFRFFLWCC